MPRNRLCLLGCKPTKTMYSFPDDEDRRRLWLDIVKVEDVSKRYIYLCSRHFSEKMFSGSKLHPRKAYPDLYTNRDEIKSSKAIMKLEKALFTIPIQDLQNHDSTEQKCIKIMTLPKNIKIVPFKKRQSDPLLVPHTNLTVDNIIKHPIKIVDGRAIKLPYSKVESNEATHSSSSAVQTKNNEKSDKKIGQQIVWEKTIQNMFGKRLATGLLDKHRNENSSENAIEKSLIAPMQEFDEIDETMYAECELIEEDDKLNKDAGDLRIPDASEETISHDTVEENYIPRAKKMRNEDGTVELINEQNFDCGRSDDSDSLIGSKDYLNDAHHTTVDCENVSFISQGTQTGTKVKHACGMIEIYAYNGTFTMTCFYCSMEFPLWNWKQFVTHLASVHKFEIKLTDRKLKATNEITATTTMELAQHPKQVLSNLNCALNLSELESNSNVQYVLTQDTDTNTMALVPLQQIIKSELTDEDLVMQTDNINEGVMEDFSSYSLAENSNLVDDDEQDSLPDVAEPPTTVETIDMDKTAPPKILKFLELLKAHPILWHKRRHGPSLYDSEAENFLAKFQNSMTLQNFRNSMDNLHAWYRRFVPPTSKVAALLAKDAARKRVLGMCSEIVALSKAYTFQCDQCNYYFLEPARLATHRYLRHKIGELPHLCSCGLRFESADRKEAHESTHQPKPAFICELCGASFFIHRSLLGHMNSKHADAVDNPMPFECETCGAKFPTQQTRSWHILHHAPPRYKCDMCGKTYYKDFPFRQHMKRHLNQRDFICEHCGKAFIERRSLITHRFRVHKAGGFHCAPCDTYFSTLENLTEHRQWRHPEGSNYRKIRPTKLKPGEKKKRACSSWKPRVFKCKQCGSVFERQFQLMRHKRSLGHTLGERYFKCNIGQCSVVFKSPVALVRHLQHKHQLQIKSKDINYEDYAIPTLESSELMKEDDIVVNDSEAEEIAANEYALQTINYTEENDLLIQEEEIHGIFQDFEGGIKTEA